MEKTIELAIDALDAYEAGHLTAEAALRVVAAILRDKESQRETAAPSAASVPPSPLDRFRTPAQQQRAAAVHTEAARYFARQAR